MKRIIALLLTAHFSLNILAQDKIVTNLQNEAKKEVKKEGDIKHGWYKGGSFGLALGQGGARHWTAGAEEFSFSTNAQLFLFANRKDSLNRFYWDNALTSSFGFITATSSGARKSDDRIDIISKYGLKLFDRMFFSNLVNFRTQFTEGYDYKQLIDTAAKKYKRISHLMAPAYVTVASGLEWKPREYFSLFYSPISARWIIVSNHPQELAANYNVDPRQEVTIEAGSFLTANFKKEIFKNVLYQSRADFYSNYLREPFKADLFWTNTVLMKVNKFLTVSYNLDMIYDDDAQYMGKTAGLQIRSLLGIGFTTKL
jgi:hypothetical protein